MKTANQDQKFVDFAVKAVNKIESSESEEKRKDTRTQRDELRFAV